MKRYLPRNGQYHPAYSHLFISTKSVKKIWKNSILFWLKVVIKGAYKSASDSDCSAVKARVHAAWSIGASMLFKKNF